MDVKLPNGKIIRGVPDGTSKEEVKAKAIASGVATEQDFAAQSDFNALGSERSFSEKAAGVGEAALSAVTSTLAEPIAGIAGLARTATQGAEAGADRVNEMRQSLTYQPQTEAGKEYLQDVGELPIIKQAGEIAQGAQSYAGRKAYELTGSPLVAAIAEGLPAATGAALGAKAPGGLAAMADNQATVLAGQGARLSNAAQAGIDADRPMPTATTEVVKSLSPEKIRDIADVDPEFFRALDKIGVTAEPLTSYASRNPQFRGVEQGLAAIPGSALAPAEQAFIKDLSGAAQGVFEKYGAVKDSAGKSMEWRDASLKSIDGLGQAADKAYDTIGEMLDKRQPANPIETMRFLDEVTKDLPLGIDDPDVPAALKKAYQSIQPRQRVNPETEAVEIIPANYESMDRLRKNIGAAAFKKEGDFKDADSAILKRLYGSLTDDLNVMAEAQGAAEQVKLGKALVAQRKQLETQMQELIGKDLQKDIVPVVQSGVKGLAKGGLQRYVDTMKQIPDPKVRQELLMTALNDTFSKTLAGTEQFTPTDFIKWYDGTLAKPTVRNLLARDMPKGAIKRLDALATISRGMAVAKSDKIKTGVVNSLLDDKAGMIRRMVGVGIKRVPIANEVASALGDVLDGTTKRSELAGNLLASPEFAHVIRQGVAKGVMTGTKAAEQMRKAESSLVKSAAYKAWAGTLKDSEKAQLASVGITSFLLSPQQEQENKD